MIHNLVLRTALAVAIAAGPTAAVAKPKPTPAPILFTAADVNRIAPPIDPGCILGAAAKAATPEQKIANCTAAIASIEALKAKARSRVERAGLAYLMASFDFARAGGYLGIDKVRSARVCTTAERAYAQLTGVDPALFEAELAQALQTSRAAVSRSAAACRKDFGTPPGAPALMPL